MSQTTKELQRRREKTPIASASERAHQQLFSRAFVEKQADQFLSINYGDQYLKNEKGELIIDKTTKRPIPIGSPIDEMTKQVIGLIAPTSEMGKKAPLSKKNLFAFTRLDMKAKLFELDVGPNDPDTKLLFAILANKRHNLYARSQTQDAKITQIVERTDPVTQAILQKMSGFDSLPRQRNLEESEEG